MKEIEFKSFDGKKLACFLWDDVAGIPKGVIQLVHGLTSHTMRYEDFAKTLNANGYIVFGDDHRMNGKTAGLEKLGKAGKNNFNENEAIDIDAELYNDSYQLVNDPEVNILITDANKKNFPYAFTRTSNAYYLNAGSLPPGEYSYKATTSFGGKAFLKTGKFSVMSLNVESMSTVANHGLLNNIAARHKGKMVYPNQLDQIEQLLAARDDMKTVVYTQKRYTDLVCLLPVLFLLLALLSAEWFIRKRNGSY